MKTTVEVHATVHPLSAPASFKRQTDRPKGVAYGSWCSPDLTPAHAPVTQTNSNIDSKTQLRDGTQNKQEKEFAAQEIRRFSSSPPPPYKLTENARQQPLELKPIKGQLSREDSSKRAQLEKDHDAIVVDDTQSPTPSSPTRRKKCIELCRISSLCHPFKPIDPHGRRYIIWLLIVNFCYSYNAWCIALRVTFTLYQTPQNTPYWMIADYLCDVIYLIDVALVKPRLIFLHEGFWVKDINETRKNYRRKLQYKFDVLSLLPLDLLYLIFGPKTVILRLPRLLKLQTFWEFHKAMDRLLSSPYVVRIGKTLFYIFYLIHLNACAYYYMSYIEGIGSNGWVYDGVGNAYIRCFYFATKTATSIGKNPKPENTTEYLFMTAAWLMGVFVFALLIGQIRDIIATATRAKEEYRKNVDGCCRYLRKLSMPQSLQRRVTAWFSYTWTQQRSFDDNRILNSLPFNMKCDVALAVHINTLSKVQLFRDCSASLLRDLVLQLRPESFLPGDVVVRRGDVGHHMYIIKSGECYVLSQDEKEILATLREGSVFGEISLMGIEGLRRRTATVRSRGYSDLFALSKSDLDAALKHHKEAALILRRRADQLVRENAARQTNQRIAERQARKSASIAEDGGSLAKNRRSSSVSNVSSARERRRARRASGQSKGRLSSVVEDKVPHSLAASCAGIANPLPTIVFTSD